MQKIIPKALNMSSTLRNLFSVWSRRWNLKGQELGTLRRGVRGDK